MTSQSERPEPQRPWGAPPAEPPPDAQPDHPRWTRRKSLVAVLVAAGIAAGGWAAVYGASGSIGAAGREPAGPAGYGPWGGPGPGGPDGPGGPGGGGPMGPNGANLLNALHGEFVVAEDGGYVTKLMQVGELVEASDESITVRSADGFTATYALDAGTTKADVAAGDTVRVIAIKSGDDLTADVVNTGVRPAPPAR